MNLKNLRKANKKTQNDIADFLNMTTVGYAHYEQEEREPSIQTLCKLADYYNVSMDYLIGRQFENDLGFLTKEEQEFIKIYLKLNQQNKINIAGYALGLYSQQEED